MGAKGEAVKAAVKSNADAGGGLGGIFGMFKVGPQGIGAKENWKGLSPNHTEMRNAHKVLKNAGTEKKQLQDAIAAETAKAEPNLKELSKMKRRLDGFDTVVGGYQDAFDEAKGAFTGNLKGLAMVGPRYLGATDRRGMDGRFMTGLARSGAAAGAYMGAATATRYIGGGGFTYNSNGEQDIAGIPFI